MWGPLKWCVDKCRGQRRKVQFQAEQSLVEEDLSEDNQGPVTSDYGAMEDAESSDSDSSSDQESASVQSKRCSSNKEPCLSLSLTGQGVRLFAAGLLIQDIAQWIIAATKLPLDQQCKSEGGVPFYTLYVVALGSGVTWLVVHIPNLVYQKKHASLPEEVRRTRITSIEAKNRFEALFRGYAHIGVDGNTRRAASTLMVALAWAQIPHNIESLWITQQSNATLHNATAILDLEQQFAFISLGTFVLIFGFTGVNYLLVHIKRREHVIALCYRNLTDLMAVVSLPLLLPAYLNDLLNMVPGYNSEDLPTLTASFVLAGVVGMLFGARLCSSALRRSRCLNQVIEWCNVDMLNSMNGAPYLIAMVGTMAQCFTPSDAGKPMLTEGVGILITLLAVAVVAVIVISNIIQCCFRQKPSMQNRQGPGLARNYSINSVGSSRVTTFAKDDADHDSGSSEEDDAGADQKAKVVVQPVQPVQSV